MYSGDAEWQACNGPGRVYCISTAISLGYLEFLGMKYWYQLKILLKVLLDQYEQTKCSLNEFWCHYSFSHTHRHTDTQGWSEQDPIGNRNLCKEIWIVNPGAEQRQQETMDKGWQQSKLHNTLLKGQDWQEFVVFAVLWTLFISVTHTQDSVYAKVTHTQSIESDGTVVKQWGS